MLRSDVSPTHVHRPGAKAPERRGTEQDRRQDHADDAGRRRRDPAFAAQMVQLLTPEGVRVPDREYDPLVADVGEDQIVDLYRDMVVVRRIDVEATALQRQGQLGLWPPLLGQEAAQVGSARSLRNDDFVFTSYRENAVAYCRGVTPTDLVRVWRGTALSGWDPYAVGMATPQVIIGAQTLHATGYAMGCVKDGTDSVAVAYFGDGATSQGDVNEAMVFAASFRAPVVFFCQNNQWAISEPVGLQARRPIADRAPGFGIPSIRVDGNDVLAVMAATRSALDRARGGGGPTFIEAVTYRRGPHTTSDDPTRYVDPKMHQEWEAKDPLLRVERLLEHSGRLTEELVQDVRATADAVAKEMRDGCYALQPPEPLSLFDNLHVRPTAWTERQRSQYAAYLSMYGDADRTDGAESGGR